MRHGLPSWSLNQYLVYLDLGRRPPLPASELRRNWAFQVLAHPHQLDGTTNRCNRGLRIGCAEVPLQPQLYSDIHSRAHTLT